MKPSQDKLAAVDAAVAAFYTAQNPPSLVFGVISAGRVIWSNAVGKISLEKDLAASEESIFPVASMTKSFVAAAILKLRDQKKLALDSIAKEFVPQLNHDKRWNYLTVYDLLAHQSGLPYDDAWADRNAGIADDELTKLFAEPFTYAGEPREGYQYSNLGYMILGRIVSEVSGVRLQDFISEQLLKPLNMRSTVWGVGKGLSPAYEKFARGYVRRGPTFVEELFSESISDVGGFAGLRSSLKDLAVWVEFLCSAYQTRGTKWDSILSSKSRREMQKTTVLIPDNTPRGGHGTYAMGLRRHSCKVGWAVGHSGGLPGSGTHMRWHPELDIGVIALSNSTYCPVWNLCEEALDILVDGETPQFPPNELVAKRGQELIKIIRGGVDPTTTAVFASNFFKDCPPEIVVEQFNSVRKQINSAKESAPHVSYGRGLSAEVYIGENTLFRFSLAPHEEGRVQSVEVTPA